MPLQFHATMLIVGATLEVDFELCGGLEQSGALEGGGDRFRLNSN